MGSSKGLIKQLTIGDKRDDDDELTNPMSIE